MTETKPDYDLPKLVADLKKRNLPICYLAAEVIEKLILTSPAPSKVEAPAKTAAKAE